MKNFATFLAGIFFCIISVGCSRSTIESSNTQKSGLPTEMGTPLQEAAVTPQLPLSPGILETNPLRIYGDSVFERRPSYAQLARIINEKYILEIADYPDDNSSEHQAEAGAIAAFDAWDKYLAKEAWELDKRLYAFLPDKFKTLEMSRQYVNLSKSRAQTWWRIQHYVPLSQVQGVIERME